MEKEEKKIPANVWGRICAKLETSDGVDGTHIEDCILKLQHEHRQLKKRYNALVTQYDDEAERLDRYKKVLSDAKEKLGVRKFSEIPEKIDQLIPSS